MAMTLDNIADICSGAIAKQMELRQSLNLLPFHGAPGYYAPGQIIFSAEIMVRLFIEGSDIVVDKLKTLFYCTTNSELRYLAFQLIKLEDTNVLRIMVLMMYMITTIEKLSISHNSQFYRFVRNVINNIMDNIPDEDLELPILDLNDINWDDLIYLDTNFKEFFHLFTN